MWPNLKLENETCGRCGLVRRILHPPGRDGRWHACPQTIASSAIEAYERILEEVPPNPHENAEQIEFGGRTLHFKGRAADPRQEYVWWDWDDEDGGRILPSPRSFWTPYLYRGQTARYDPCVPNLFRGFPVVDVKELPAPDSAGRRHASQILKDEQVDFVLLWHIRLKEFSFLLDAHPAVEHGRELGLHVARESLAQHYELLTDRLDLSCDPEVACFFATCQPDAEGVWRPVTEGLGVVYRFDFTVFSQGNEDEDTTFLQQTCEPVGLQVFPRPEEQKAWTIRLPPAMDFHRMPVTVFYFRQTEKGAMRFLERFDGGRALFPPDVLAEGARKIKQESTLSREVVEAALMEEGCASQLLNEATQYYCSRFEREFGVTITERLPMRFALETVRELSAMWAEKRRTLLDNVVFMSLELGPDDPTPLETCSTWLSDRGPWRRTLAAKLLGGMGEKALPSLQRALRDDCADVREAARDAINRIHHATAEPER